MEQYKLVKIKRKKDIKRKKKTISIYSQIVNTPLSSFAKLHSVSFPFSLISKPNPHHNISPLKQWSPALFASRVQAARTLHAPLQESNALQLSEILSWLKPKRLDLNSTANTSKEAFVSQPKTQNWHNLTVYQELQNHDVWSLQFLPDPWFLCCIKEHYKICNTPHTDQIFIYKYIYTHRHWTACSNPWITSLVRFILFQRDFYLQKHAHIVQQIYLLLGA